MKFALFKYLIVFYTFLTVAFAMGEGYEEISACLDDSLSDYNVYFNDQRPVTVEPREIRDFDADLDSIVTECISYLNLTAIVGTRGNIQYINSLHSYDEDDDVYTFDYLNDAHFLSFKSPIVLDHRLVISHLETSTISLNYSLNSDSYCISVISTY